jgi:hypothetical protein
MTRAAELCPYEAVGVMSSVWCCVWPVRGPVGIHREMRLRGLLVPTILICLLGVGLVACGGSSDGNKATATSANGTPGSTTPDAAGGGGAGGSNVTLTIADGTAAVGGTVVLELDALHVGTPGLGAFTVDVSYDSSVASAASCKSPENQGLGFCNANFASGKVRAVGAIAEGKSGDVPLATITFKCDKAGRSDLTISVDTLADATIGNPTDISHTEQGGSITCS